MQRTLNILDNVKIAAPCSVPWVSMRGDDRVRFCDQCKLHVYNLSAMHVSEIETLLREREGRLCIGLYRRADGTYLTDNCPVGLRILRNGVRRAISRFAAAVVALLCATGVMAASDFNRVRSNLIDRQPFATIAQLLWPGSRGVTLAGMAPPPSAPAGPSQMPATAAPQNPSR